jgi:hypothetical protein
MEQAMRQSRKREATEPEQDRRSWRGRAFRSSERQARDAQWKANEKLRRKASVGTGQAKDDRKTGERKYQDVERYGHTI